MNTHKNWLTTFEKKFLKNWISGEQEPTFTAREVNLLLYEVQDWVHAYQSEEKRNAVNARWNKTTAEERSDYARKMVVAREAKRAQKNKPSTDIV